MKTYEAYRSTIKSLNLPEYLQQVRQVLKEAAVLGFVKDASTLLSPESVILSDWLIRANVICDVAVNDPSQSSLMKNGAFIGIKAFIDFFHQYQEVDGTVPNGDGFPIMELDRFAFAVGHLEDAITGYVENTDAENLAVMVELQAALQSIALSQWNDDVGPYCSRLLSAMTAFGEFSMGQNPEHRDQLILGIARIVVALDSGLLTADAASMREHVSSNAATLAAEVQVMVNTARNAIDLLAEKEELNAAAAELAEPAHIGIYDNIVKSVKEASSRFFYETDESVRAPWFFKMGDYMMSVRRLPGSEAMADAILVFCRDIQTAAANTTIHAVGTIPEELNRRIGDFLGVLLQWHNNVLLPLIEKQKQVATGDTAVQDLEPAVWSRAPEGDNAVYSEVLKNALSAYFGSPEQLSESTVETVLDDLHTFYMHQYMHASANGLELPSNITPEVLEEVNKLHDVVNLNPNAIARFSPYAMANLQYTTFLDLLEVCPEGIEPGPAHTAVFTMCQLSHIFNTFIFGQRKGVIFSSRTKRYLVNTAKELVSEARSLLQDGKVEDLHIQDLMSKYVQAVDRELYAMDFGGNDERTEAIHYQNFKRLTMDVQGYMVTYYGKAMVG